MKAAAVKSAAVDTRGALLLRMGIFTAIYLGLSYFGSETGRNLLYPIRVFVTFLHEFGHAAGALLIGGTVESIIIEPNAGGMTTTLGGNRPITIAGGYIGSALFGNIMVYVGAKRPRLVKPMTGLIIAILLITGIVWYKTVFTAVMLFLFAGGLFFAGFKSRMGREVLIFLGLASVIYILQDTAYGPSSDLAQFAREMRFIPAPGWMLIWFAIAIGILLLNLKLLLGAKPDVPLPRAIKTRDFS